MCVSGDFFPTLVNKGRLSAHGGCQEPLPGTARAITAIRLRALAKGRHTDQPVTSVSSRQCCWRPSASRLARPVFGDDGTHCLGPSLSFEQPQGTLQRGGRKRDADLVATIGLVQADSVRSTGRVQRCNELGARPFLTPLSRAQQELNRGIDATTDARTRAATARRACESGTKELKQFRRPAERHPRPLDRIDHDDTGLAQRLGRARPRPGGPSARSPGRRDAVPSTSLEGRADSSASDSGGSGTSSSVSQPGHGTTET